MRRSLMLFGLLGMVLIAAFAVYAVEYSTWGKTKAALHDEGVGPLARKPPPSVPIRFEVTSEDGSAIGIEGVCPGNYDYCLCGEMVSGPARGRASSDSPQLIVNKPSIMTSRTSMPFLEYSEWFDGTPPVLLRGCTTGRMMASQKPGSPSLPRERITRRPGTYMPW